PTWNRVLWAVIEGLVAIGLLLAGGLVALQTGAIITALPFSFIMIAICFATHRALRAEHLVLLRAERRQRREEWERQVTSQVTSELTENFDAHFGAPLDEHVERHFSRRDRLRGVRRKD